MTNEDFKKAEEQIFGSIKAQIGDKVPTEDEFIAAAGKSRQIYDLSITVLNLPKLTDEEYKKILDSIREHLTVKMSGIDVYIEGDEEHENWLNEVKGKLDWFFWTRYANYLIHEKKWSPSLIVSLNETSDKILNLLGNPKSEKSFARRGLIIGDVQSGKTASYTAICNKVADAGYHVVIVLTGMLEDLRKQTQERLDLEFAGRKSQIFLSNANGVAKSQIVGVAKYGNKTNKRIPQFTSVLKDFNVETLRSQNLDIRDLNGTILFVVKKNKSVLENLIAWLKNSAGGEDKKIDRSLLLLDDEADNASINTNKIEEEPTAINQCIRKILSKFYQTTYVGITATPFANIFINPESEGEMLEDDLFPKDFIYALDVPENYIGPSAIFGDDGKYKNMLVVIEPEENPDIEAYIPKSHKSTFQISDFPPSLYEAMNYFLLVNAIRDLQGYKNTHRTMLIHVSRFINVQKQVYNRVREWLYGVTADLRNYAALSAESAEKNSKYIAELHKVFDKHNFEEICGIDWQEFLKKYLREAVEPVTTGLRNSSEKETFDYTLSPEGLRVIAIGGNSFSRGLTLEGLCVTYFYRHSKTYDTLMQMGRWFGYRPHYDNLCKIWTSQEIIDWYGYITEVSNELRDEISVMQQYGMTPKDFGLKVRQHPGALMITAKNKMRFGTPVKRPVELNKIFLETPRLIFDIKILKANENLILDFVNSIKDFPKMKNAGETISWSGVPKEKVADLIFKFKTSPWYLEFQSHPIGEYILNKMDNQTWDVLIPEGFGDDFGLKVGDSEIKINPIQRQISVGENQIKIGGHRVRIGNIIEVRNTLSKEEIKKAEQEYKSARGKKNIQTLPNRAYMIYGRKPLLVLYVIEPGKGKIKSVPDVLFAIGVGFPAQSPNIKNTNIVTADYVANVVASNEYNFSDWYDDDEDVEE